MASIPLVPQLFAAGVFVAMISVTDGTVRWLISGAPLLTYCLLLGAYLDYRVLPTVGLWTLIATLNLAYAVSATSWLFYWVFTASMYPIIFIVCLFQFDVVARLVRKRIRRALKTSHFLNDKIAYFDLPALEIDTEVDGLMVIRGLTFKMSTLTVIAHGVEVGIKLSDDMELSMQVEEVTMSLFRNIHVGDVYANIKGGEYEMSFGEISGETKNANGDALMQTTSLMQTDTPMLRAATQSQNDLAKMTDVMTNGRAPEPVEDPVKAVEKSITSMDLDDAAAAEKYEEIIRTIKRTNSIDESRVVVNGISEADETPEKPNDKDLRAAICSQLHNKATVRHPPKTSIKVTTLQTMLPPMVRRYLHRMPLLYRLLLNPISYFHPVDIDSITATASGQWIQHILNEKVFRKPNEDESETSRLERRVAAWLSKANFVFELNGISATAQVPIIRGFDITCLIGFADVMAYRALPEETALKQVIRLGGADASVKVPSFLLPHHEHWLPAVPTVEDIKQRESDVENADGKPQAIQAARDTEQMKKDETNVKMSAHVRLPAVFDQELLDFIAALVKATKVMELERELKPNGDDDEDDEEIEDGAPGSDADSITSSIAPTTSIDSVSTEKGGKRNLKHFAAGFKTHMHELKQNTKDLNAKVKSNIRRSTINAVANDRWIAKMVGKITRQLETAQGDLGYSGELPVPLAVFRTQWGWDKEGPKILS